MRDDFPDTLPSQSAGHTEGPWEVHEHNHVDGEFWCSIGARGWGPITDIVGAEGNHSRFFVPVAGMKYLVTPVEEQRANAALIARAPDLLTENSKLKGQLEEAVVALKQIAGPTFKGCKFESNATVTGFQIGVQVESPQEIAREALSKLKEAGS